MRRPRRNHSPAFKAKVAVAALTSDATLAASASLFDVHAHQITQWKQQLVAQAAALFSSDGVRGDATPPVDLKDLHAKSGQQALAIDVLAGALGQPLGPSAKRSSTPTHELPLTQQARVLGLSRASIHYTPRGVPAPDLAHMRRVAALHLELPFAGSRMRRDLLGARASSSDGIMCGPSCAVWGSARSSADRARVSGIRSIRTFRICCVAC